MEPTGVCVGSQTQASCDDRLKTINPKGWGGGVCFLLGKFEGWERRTVVQVWEGMKKKEQYLFGRWCGSVEDWKNGPDSPTASEGIKWGQQMV